MMAHNMEGSSMMGQGKMCEKPSARSKQVCVEGKGKYVSHPNPGQKPQGRVQLGGASSNRGPGSPEKWSHPRGGRGT